MVQNYSKEKMFSNLYRKIIISIIIIILLLIWVELGVGIFGTRFAGNYKFYSEVILSIEVTVNFTSSPRISSVKSSPTFFPATDLPKGE